MSNINYQPTENLDMEQEITIDEAVNAKGDVTGVMTIGTHKIKYFIEGECIEECAAAGRDIVDEVKRVIRQSTTRKAGS